MRKAFISSIFLLFSFVAYAQKTNPASNIDWTKLRGSGTPSATCQASYSGPGTASYGQPYIDTATNKHYVCRSTGWVNDTVDPTQTGTQTMGGPLSAPVVDKGGQVWNVLNSGAKCDASTDDTTAIQSALTTYGPSMKVILPAGKRCEISGVLTFPANTNFDLNGSRLDFLGIGGGTCAAGVNGLIQIFNGNSSVKNGIIAVSGAANCLINMAPSSFTGQNTIDNIAITATFANSTTCIRVDNQFNTVIKNSSFTNCAPYAIQAVGAGVINGFNIENNAFEIGSQGTDPFIHITNGTSDFRIQSNAFEINPAIYVAESNQPYNVDIEHNWIGDGSPAYGIKITGGSGSIIADNLIAGSTSTTQGIVIGSSSSTGGSNAANSVYGNQLYSLKDGIVDYGSGTNVYGNSIAVTRYGYYGLGASNIWGNYITGGTTSIYLSTTQNFVGTNAYYAGSISCPNGGNIIQDMNMAPNSNCTGIVGTSSGSWTATTLKSTSSLTNGGESSYSGYAACYSTNGVMGHCTTVVSSIGTCTCSQ